MKVSVQYTAQLRTAVGRREEVVELPEGSTLSSLLSYLATTHGDRARTHFLAANGNPLGCLLVVVNDEAKSPSDAAATVLEPDTVVVLLPPIAGG